jgi:TM2 domain-containing membrane protein YozV
MSYSLSLFAGAGWQFFDNNGTILSGGKLYTYSAGTTSPLATYTSSTAVTLNPNPIILDSAGRVPAEVWVNSSSIAKFVLKDSTDVLIGTWDNIPSLVSSLNLTGTNNGVVYFNSVGTFSSGSNLTFDGTNLSVAGAATVGTNLNVAGASALTGNTTVGGTLNVTGATTLSGNATVGGTAIFNGAVTHNSTTTLSGATTATGTFTTLSTTTLATGSTLAATPTTGDSSTKIASTAFVANTSLGVGQTYGGSWSSGVTYYNTYGKPIFVSVCSGNGVNALYMYVDGAQVAYNYSNSDNYKDSIPLFAIVPPNKSWSISGTTTFITVLY